MIKYETSLEQAKQIKELGFDFSPICEKFKTPVGTIWYKPVRDNLRSERAWYIYVSPIVEDGRYLNALDESLLIPIIPYPILEACLPEIEIEDKDNYDKQFSYPNIFETRYWEYSCEDMSETTVIKTFNNPCEAFAWSIKNYPEETRKRFNEVMEAYK